MCRNIATALLECSWFSHTVTFVYYYQIDLMFHVTNNDALTLFILLFKLFNIIFSLLLQLLYSNCVRILRKYFVSLVM